MADRPAPPRMDRSAFSVASSFEEAEAADREWWWAQTPEFRLGTVQHLREQECGEAANGPMVRVMELVQREPDGSERVL